MRIMTGNENQSEAASASTVIIRPLRGWSPINFGELWQYRELHFYLTWREIKIRYKQTALGIAWAILQPLLKMVVFTLFFGNLAKVPSERIPYPLFNYAALLPWTLFAEGINRSSQSLVQGTSLIQKIYFPRLAMPIAGILSPLVDFTIAFIILIGDNILWLLPHTANPFTVSFCATGGDDLPRCGTMAFGNKREIPRRSLCNTISDSTLALRFTSSLLQQPPSQALASFIRTKPDGRGNRRLPLVFPGHRPTRFPVPHVNYHHCYSSGIGGILLPTYGKNLCRCDIGKIMSDTAIRVESLGKQYRLGQYIGYKTLQDSLMNAITSPFRRSHSTPTAPESESSNSDDKYIWALKDVAFQVKQGEAVGIIGRNVARKTTLLKILTRITTPTKGYAEIRGRVGSLLEVSTGFHPELTGRENVYLNGAVLGMRKKEIDHRFDDIVEFAEVQKFIDTPLKRYSSGMQVRLAFSVAAHLEPETMLVDEVLAVGDYKFQKKCLGKMGEISHEGRTVLLVSHNMTSILNLCSRAVLLDSGRVVMDGRSEDVVQHYIATVSKAGGEAVWPDPVTAPGNDVARIHAVRILQEGIDGPTADVDISKEVTIQISYWNLREGALLYRAIILMDKLNTLVLSSNNHRSASLTEDPWYGRPQPKGLFQSTCRIPGNFLNDGLYSITAIVGTGASHTEAMADNAVSFHVHDTGEMRQKFYGGWGGVVRPRLAWHTEYTGTTGGVANEHNK